MREKGEEGEKEEEGKEGQEWEEEKEKGEEEKEKEKSVWRRNRKHTLEVQLTCMEKIPAEAAYP